MTAGTAARVPAKYFVDKAFRSLDHFQYPAENSAQVGAESSNSVTLCVPGSAWSCLWVWD